LALKIIGVKCLVVGFDFVEVGEDDVGDFLVLFCFFFQGVAVW
jgi:hypothetical protein